MHTIKTEEKALCSTEQNLHHFVLLLQENGFHRMLKIFNKVIFLFTLKGPPDKTSRDPRSTLWGLNCPAIQKEKVNQNPRRLYALR